jgi:drug/metabolite transporter (DMT)-like permease
VAAQHYRKELWLLLCSTFIWGSAFVFVKWMLPYLNPWEVNHLRFYVAGFLSALMIFFGPSKWRKSPVMAPMLGALCLYGTLTFQTIGLNYTTVAKSGFITTLYVLLIPIFQGFLQGKTFKWAFWGKLLMALMGLYFLAGAQWEQLNRGDFYTFICSIFAAVHILTIGKYMKNYPSSFAFNCWQCVFLALIGLVVSPFVHDPLFVDRISNFPLLPWLGLLGLSVFSSIIAFSIQTFAQKKIPEHLAGLLFLMESPFAALTGYLFLGETLSAVSCFGALLIICACALAIQDH